MHRKILFGFAIGAGSGLLAHFLWPTTPSWLNAILNYVIEPCGQLFLRLLLLAVLPLVVSSLMLGVAEMRDAARRSAVGLL